MTVPASLGRTHRGVVSTQQAFGRFFVDLSHEAAEVADDMKHRVKNRAEELISRGQDAVHDAEDRLRLRALAPEGDVLIAGWLYLAGEVLQLNRELPD